MTHIFGSNVQSKEAAFEKIDNMDLSPIKMKLMLPIPEGQAWNQDQADEAETWYKRFLKICLKYPDIDPVPNGPIDAFWHAHILDTQKYMTDCNEIFGEYMHHYPYYGLNGDAQQRDDSFDLTNEAYRAEFGEDCVNMFSGHTASYCSPGDDEEEFKTSSIASHCGTGNGDGDYGDDSTKIRRPRSIAAVGMKCTRGGFNPITASVNTGQKCTHSGSGTGCRQGCRKGS